MKVKCIKKWTSGDKILFDKNHIYEVSYFQRVSGEMIYSYDGDVHYFMIFDKDDILRCIGNTYFSNYFRIYDEVKARQRKINKLLKNI